MKNLIEMNKEWYILEYEEDYTGFFLEIDVYFKNGDLTINLDSLSEVEMKLHTLKEIADKLTEVRGYLLGKMDKEKEIKDRIGGAI